MTDECEKCGQKTEGSAMGGGATMRGGPPAENSPRQQP